MTTPINATGPTRGAWYAYHVAYAYAGGFGAMEVTTPTAVRTSNDVTDMTRFVREKSGQPNAVVLTWQRLDNVPAPTPAR